MMTTPWREWIGWVFLGGFLALPASGDPLSFEQRFRTEFDFYFAAAHAGLKMRNDLKHATRIAGTAELLNLLDDGEKLLDTTLEMEPKAKTLFVVEKEPTARSGWRFSGAPDFPVQHYDSPNWTTSVLLREMYRLAAFRREPAADFRRHAKIADEAMQAQATYLAAAQESVPTDDPRVLAVLAAAARGFGDVRWRTFAAEQRTKKVSAEKWEPATPADKRRRESQAQMNAMRASIELDDAAGPR